MEVTGLWKSVTFFIKTVSKNKKVFIIIYNIIKTKNKFNKVLIFIGKFTILYYEIIISLKWLYKKYILIFKENEKNKFN